MNFIYLLKLLFFCLFVNRSFSCCCCCEKRNNGNGSSDNVDTSLDLKTDLGAISKLNVVQGDDVKINSNLINIPMENKEEDSKKNNYKLKKGDENIKEEKYVKKSINNFFVPKNSCWEIQKGGYINLTTEDIYNKNVEELFKLFKEDFKYVEKKDIDVILEKIVKHKLGFKNLNNTCYLNSCLQFLTHNYDFLRCVLWKIIHLMNSNVAKIKNATIAMSFCRLLFFIYADKNNGYIRRLLESILYFFIYKNVKDGNYFNDYKYKTFNYKEQADINDFLSLFFDDLEKELDIELFSVFLNVGKDYIYIPGSKIRENYQKNYFLNLAVGNKNTTLRELISKINNSPENINDFNVDGKKCSVTKQTFFLQNTLNLLIYLKRYYIDSATVNQKKIESDINFDEEIEIGDTETDRKKYEIMSIIVHSGDSYGGHYICYVKIDGEWYLFDDSNTTKIGNFATVRDYKLYNSYEAGAKKAYFISAKLIEENKKD